jgi:hypothetical protein
MLMPRSGAPLRTRALLRLERLAGCAIGIEWVRFLTTAVRPSLARISHYSLGSVDGVRPGTCPIQRQAT